VTAERDTSSDREAAAREWAPATAMKKWRSAEPKAI
jgi:hypothetical protein